MPEQFNRHFNKVKVIKPSNDFAQISRYTTNNNITTKRNCKLIVHKLQFLHNHLTHVQYKKNFIIKTQLWFNVKKFSTELCKNLVEIKRDLRSNCQKKFHFFRFNSSNLLVRSSKSTSSPPTELTPMLFTGTLGRPGMSGNTGRVAGPGPVGCVVSPEDFIPRGAGVGSWLLAPSDAEGNKLLEPEGGSYERNEKVKIKCHYTLILLNNSNYNLYKYIQSTT